MPIEKEKIFQGDTLPVALECRKPNPDDPNDSRGLPATPTSATARVYDSLNEVFLFIGGGTDDTADCTIVAQTGIDPDDKGAIVSYTVPSAFTAEAGDYKLFITAVFPDGAILTEDKAFKVLELR